MGRESTLRASVPAAGAYALNVTARALDRPRRIAVSLAGVDVETVVITPHPDRADALPLGWQLSDGVRKEMDALGSHGRLRNRSSSRPLNG
jgi:hypothetical protein